MITQIFKSKTMAFALLLEVLGVIQVNADILSAMLTPAQFGWVMIGTGIAVRMLRFVTTNRLCDK